MFCFVFIHLCSITLNCIKSMTKNSRITSIGFNLNTILLDLTLSLPANINMASYLTLFIISRSKKNWLPWPVIENHQFYKLENGYFSHKIIS